MGECVNCGNLCDDRAERCKSCAQSKIQKEKYKKRRNKVEELYKNGERVADISNILGCSRSFIYTVINERNLKKRNGRSYPLKVDAFSKEVPNKYYVLGLFAADGYIGVNKGSKYISMSLHKDDVVLLRDLKKFFETNKPLNKSNDQRILTLYCDKYYDYLNNFGVVENKSLFLKITKGIPNKYVRDFLRGVFAGDGCITHSKKRKDGSCYPHVDLAFTASSSFADQLCEYYSKIGVEGLKRYKRDNGGHPLYTLRINGNESIRVLNKLYRKGSLFMPRKYEKFLEYSRLTVDESMMEAAYLFSKRSTCCRAKVGCVITDDSKRNIKAIGYNGQASEITNSCESSYPGECGCIHAEVNALTKNTGDFVYSTLFPCKKCAKVLVNSNVKKVYWGESYRDMVPSKRIFWEAGVQMKQIDRKSYKWKLDLKKDFLNEGG